METKGLNLYQKMAHISADIEKVKKGLTVKAGGETYKAVGEPDVLRAVKPLEESYGVYSYPVGREIIETGIHETKSGAKMLFMREKVVYRFVNVDNPSEFIDQESIGDGIDSQDKGPGKAATYADKYALLKAYKIDTGEDPDQYGSEEMGGHTSFKNKIVDKDAPPSKAFQPQEETKYNKLKSVCEKKGKSFDLVLKKVAAKFNDKRVNDLSKDEWDSVYLPMQDLPDAEIQVQ